MGLKTFFFNILYGALSGAPAVILTTLMCLKCQKCLVVVRCRPRVPVKFLRMSKYLRSFERLISYFLGLGYALVR